MRIHIVTALFFAQALAAQQVVAPTPEPAGSPRGQNVDNYNVVNSFETGYRFSEIGGNEGKYRSDVNYGTGVRLLGSQFTMNSRDGHGRFFDEIVLNTLGLGNDPYESAVLRVQKNRLYQYDMLWRLNDYYNPGLVIANGEHLRDTTRRLQDHNLTLFPQARFRLHLGYSRNSQTGAGLSTVQLFSTEGDEFPLFEQIRRVHNEYRLGGDADLFGVKLTVLHFWNDFKEDSPIGLDGLPAGNNPTDNTFLSSFQRAQPYHGTSPGWLVNLNRERTWWAANGRFTYVGGRRNYLTDETAVGASLGVAANRQVVVGGNASRPATTGDLAISVFPGSRLTVVNNTAFHNIRIDGDSVYREFDNNLLSSDLLYFRFLGIRLITNSTDAHYQVAPWLGLSGGYHFSSRRIRTVESFAFPDAPGDRNFYEQENQLHSGTAGIQIRPLKPLSIRLEGEIGRADRPFTPISDRNYQNWMARADYRTRRLTLSTAYRQTNNANSVSLSSFSSRARDYNANVSWAPRDWFGLDAGYIKLHLDTVSGVAFFAGQTVPDLVTGRNAIYISNIHTGNFGARFTVKKRVDLYAGYSITKDVGDGRDSLVPAGVTDPVTLLLTRVETFPLTFQSPLARVSIRLHPKLRWNAGWQFYRYQEKFGLFAIQQNYRAHTGYTSLSWSF